MHFQMNPLDLAVVLEQSRRLEGVEQNFPADIVQIPAPPVRRIEFGVKRDPSLKWTDGLAPCQNAYRLPVAPSLAADEHTGADVPVVVVDRRRVRKLQTDHFPLAHGGWESPVRGGWTAEAAAAPVNPALGA